MKQRIKNHFKEVLNHLYISPLERCNLDCKMCYTRKTNSILDKEEILDFIKRYQKVHRLETITFCGGEVFTLPYFPKLVNELTKTENPAESALVGHGFFPHLPNSLHDLCLRHESRGAQEPVGVLKKHGFPADSSHLCYSFFNSDKSIKSIFVQIVTNGTIDRLEELENPNMVNLIVSIDGLRDYHDKNRGKGNFDKSINFLRKARRLGFHTEIFSIVTRQNIGQIEEFEQYICLEVILNEVKNPDRNSKVVVDPSQKLRMTGIEIPVTYHPRKPESYLSHHPISNILGEVTGFDFLGKSEMLKLMKEKKTFPPRNLGCYQMALMSDRKVYGCCEGTVPLGKINDPIETLIARLRERLEIWERENKSSSCLGCSQTDFVCGLKSL